METKKKYTLGKTERLKSRKAIEQLFTDGQSFSLFPFKVLYRKLPANQQHPPAASHSLQCAFSVSKRHFKKAVERNRIKRLMREAYRLQKTVLQNELEKNNREVIAFIIYVGNDMPEHDIIFSKMAAVLKRIQKNVNEEPAANS